MTLACVVSSVVRLLANWAAGINGGIGLLVFFNQALSSDVTYCHHNSNT